MCAGPVSLQIALSLLSLLLGWQLHTSEATRFDQTGEERSGFRVLISLLTQFDKKKGGELCLK